MRVVLLTASVLVSASVTAEDFAARLVAAARTQVGVQEEDVLFAWKLIGQFRYAPR
jgi:uncharacterized protein YijF (DUF1287 family)